MPKTVTAMVDNGFYDYTSYDKTINNLVEDAYNQCAVQAPGVNVSRDTLKGYIETQFSYTTWDQTRRGMGGVMYVPPQPMSKADVAQFFGPGIASQVKDGDFVALREWDIDIDFSFQVTPTGGTTGKPTGPTPQILVRTLRILQKIRLILWAILAALAAALGWFIYNWWKTSDSAEDVLEKLTFVLWVNPLPPYAVDGSNDYKVTILGKVSNVEVYDAYFSRDFAKDMVTAYNGDTGSIDWSAGGCHNLSAHAIFTNSKGNNEDVWYPMKDPVTGKQTFIPYTPYRHTYEFLPESKMTTALAGLSFLQQLKALTDLAFLTENSFRYEGQDEAFVADISQIDIMTKRTPYDPDPQSPTYQYSSVKAYVYDGWVGNIIDPALIPPKLSDCPLDPSPHYTPNSKYGPNLLYTIDCDVSGTKASFKMNFPKKATGNWPQTGWVSYYTVVWYFTPADRVQGFGIATYELLYKKGATALPGMYPCVQWDTLGAYGSVGDTIKLTGKVYDKDGNPASGIPVTVSFDPNPSGGTPAKGTPDPISATTDDSGEFEADVVFTTASIAHTANAKATIDAATISSLPLVIVVSSRLLSFKDVGSNPCIVVVEGDTIDFTGTVTDILTGKGVQGVEVKLVENWPYSGTAAPTTPATVLTDKDGKFAASVIVDKAVSTSTPQTTSYTVLVQSSDVFGNAIGPTRTYYVWQKGTTAFVDPLTQKATNNKTNLDMMMCNEVYSQQSINPIDVIKQWGNALASNPAGTAAIIGGASAGIAALIIALHERKKKRGGR